MITRTKLILLSTILLTILIGLGIVGYRDSIHNYTTEHFRYDDSAWHIHPTIGVMLDADNDEVAHVAHMNGLGAYIRDSGNDHMVHIFDASKFTSEEAFRLDHPNTRLVGHRVYPLKRDTIYLNKIMKFLNDIRLDSVLRSAHDSDIYVKQFSMVGRADNGHDKLMGDVGKMLNKHVHSDYNFMDSEDMFITSELEHKHSNFLSRIFN